MARKVSEWIGKTDDSKAPPRVRQRVFDRDNGVCHLCKLPIKTGETWDADHRTAIINGGENRETNLSPAHKHCHIAKTAKDVAEKAKVAKIRQKHTGARRPKQSIQSRGFERKERKPKPALPPRPLFERGELWGSGRSKGD